ncbi:HK97 gp10 family phage protein [Paenibacillus planticolens]|uniref:HK97 gp10 family phage protein n=1 Tax=Paenibacillus planticolens TaxID=2654976 RepID=A0ABX1ZEG2_9BACL|nr:HK97 gp10 family phage protein [Paenibacillus planticolens]NOU98481.1 HK97 gp10 family phage protein [Paenibacillus planticolens]
MASNRIDIDLNRPGSFVQNLIGRFFRGYGERLANAAGDGARRGLEDVMDDWKREATDLAPLKHGTLRRGIHVDVDQSSGKLTGAISVTAIESKGGRSFDYAEYIHDIYPQVHGKSFKHPTTPGTIPEFLDKPMEDNEDVWKRELEREIREGLRRRGF